MTQLDAFALVAWLAGEPCAPEVRPLIRAGTSISAVDLAAVVDHMARHHEVDVTFDIEAMAATLLDVIPFDMPMAFRAGELRARHHEGTIAGIGLTECIAAATALDQGVPLATASPLLARVMAAEGGEVVALTGGDAGSAPE